MEMLPALLRLTAAGPELRQAKALQEDNERLEASARALTQQLETEER